MKIRLKTLLLWEEDMEIKISLENPLTLYYNRFTIEVKKNGGKERGFEGSL